MLDCKSFALTDCLNLEPTNITRCRVSLLSFPLRQLSLLPACFRVGLLSGSEINGQVGYRSGLLPSKRNVFFSSLGKEFLFHVPQLFSGYGHQCVCLYQEE